MVMKKDVTAGEVESVIRSKGGRLLESCELFDIYEGKQIMAGFKSMAYNIVFRAPDRTLEDREVNEIMDGIISSLKEMGIELRA
jgi:phenylalanyl-tRNA synthetase beta chain